MDGLCVRIAAMRSHSQALTIKLKKDLPLEEIERIIAEDNPWVRFVPNEREASMERLTPWPPPAPGDSGWPRAQAGHGPRVH